MSLKQLLASRLLGKNPWAPAGIRPTLEPLFSGPCSLPVSQRRQSPEPTPQSATWLPQPGPVALALASPDNVWGRARLILPHVSCIMSRAGVCV